MASLHKISPAINYGYIILKKICISKKSRSLTSETFLYLWSAALLFHLCQVLILSNLSRGHHKLYKLALIFFNLFLPVISNITFFPILFKLFSVTSSFPMSARPSVFLNTRDYNILTSALPQQIFEEKKFIVIKYFLLMFV